MTSPNTLTDGVRNAFLYQMTNVHTSFPASIVSYDYTTKKAMVQPQINRKYTDGTIQPMPILNNVPVIFPCGSGFSMTFPVNAGDFCIVMCCERSIDDWLENGTQTAPADPRKFDLSDGVAIMGLRPFSDPLPAPNNTDFLLSFEGSKITIKQNGDVIIDTSSKVAIGNSTTELLDVVSQLMGLLQGGMVMGASFEGPLDATFILAVNALQAQLDAIKGTIT